MTEEIKAGPAGRKRIDSMPDGFDLGPGPCPVCGKLPEPGHSHRSRRTPDRQYTLDGMLEYQNNQDASRHRTGYPGGGYDL